MKSVSIAVPTLGRLFHLKSCLEALAKQSYSQVEILVIDDGPNPSVVEEMVRSLGARYVRGPGTGVVPAYNLGLTEATGDIVAFTDDDAVPEEDWIEHLVSGYAGKVGGVGGTVQPADANPGEHPLFPTHITQQGRFGGWARPSGLSLEVDHLRGANMSFSRKSISATGLFDWNYEGDGYKFESDYCVRMRRMGYKIMFDPEAVVIHNESTVRLVSRGRTPSKAYYRARNNTYFALKNFMFGKNSLALGASTAKGALRTFRSLVSRRDVTYACGLAGLIVGISTYALNELQGDSLSSIGF
ncbi:MAG: glycosyltransferase [Nitrososphaerales archaeon]|jgi:GT2 family glycosyltransferase